MNLCVCSECGDHENCRGVAEPGKKRCLWCAIERKVEKRWQKMLRQEAKQTSPSTDTDRSTE